LADSLLGNPALQVTHSIDLNPMPEKLMTSSFLWAFFFSQGTNMIEDLWNRIVIFPSGDEWLMRF
jgi:hypothetical protein